MLAGFGRHLSWVGQPSVAPSSNCLPHGSLERQFPGAKRSRPWPCKRLLSTSTHTHQHGTAALLLDGTWQKTLCKRVRFRDFLIRTVNCVSKGEVKSSFLQKDCLRRIIQYPFLMNLARLRVRQGEIGEIQHLLQASLRFHPSHG